MKLTGIRIGKYKAAKSKDGKVRLVKDHAAIEAGLDVSTRIKKRNSRKSNMGDSTAAQQRRKDAAAERRRHRLGLRDEILAEIDAFNAEHGLDDGQLGFRLLGSNGLIQRWRDGATPFVRTVDKLRRGMEHEAARLAAENRSLITKLDRHGPVVCEPDGTPNLPRGISLNEFKRLVHKKILLPSSDQLFAECAPQTYRLAP